MRKLQALKITLLIVIFAEEIKRAKYNKNEKIRAFENKKVGYLFHINNLLFDKIRSFD